MTSHNVAGLSNPENLGVTEGQNRRNFVENRRIPAFSGKENDGCDEYALWTHQRPPPLTLPSGLWQVMGGYKKLYSDSHLLFSEISLNGEYAHMSMRSMRLSRVCREFDASLTRVWREFDASLIITTLMRVRCEFGASLVRVWCEFAVNMSSHDE